MGKIELGVRIVTFFYKTNIIYRYIKYFIENGYKGYIVFEN